ncbi:MAG: hypothetical protein GYA50_03705 [Eubacteriaceae bacterium]|nr:hypothetical protein [Eubacteriaceae bacterium]
MLLIDIFQAYVDDKVTNKQNMSEILKELNENSYNLFNVITQCEIQCGCIKSYDTLEYELKNINYDQLMKLYINSACDECREKIEAQIGKCILSLTSVCSLCGINIADIFIKEHRNIQHHCSANK